MRYSHSTERLAEIFDEAIIFNLLLEGLLAQHQKEQYSVDSRRGEIFSPQWKYSIVLISALGQSDSVIHTFAFFFYILFHYGLSQEIGYSSPCYTVGPCCLSILNRIVCIC